MFGVVVIAHDVVERGVDAGMAGPERQEAAVIAAVEGHHRVAARRGARQAEAHQVGLGARIAEADQLDCRKTPAHELGEPRLVPIGPAEHQPAGQRLPDRIGDRRLGMAVEPRRILAQVVDVDVPVEIGDPCPLAADDRHGERVVVQDRARVAARHAARGGLEPRLAARIGAHIAGFHVGDRGAEADVALRCCCPRHGPDLLASRTPCSRSAHTASVVNRGPSPAPSAGIANALLANGCSLHHRGPGISVGGPCKALRRPVAECSHGPQIYSAERWIAFPSFALRV